MIYYIVLIVLLSDRFAKLLVSVNLDYGQSISLAPFLYITKLINTGIAFSLFSNNNRLFLWINMIIILFIVVIIIKMDKTDILLRASYGFILGGALSNFWDRIFYSGVIDYIDLRIWPVFNLADTAITIGALLLLISAWKEHCSRKISGRA